MGGRGSGRRAAADFVHAPGDPWDRQPRESHKSFAAFKIYRDLGLDRTVAKLLGELGKKPNYRSTCEKWSTRWGWQLRAAAWDAHQDRHEREAVLKLAEKKAREQLTVADSMWKVAAKGLAMWSNHLDAASKANPNAQPSISASDVRHLAEAGIKLSLVLAGKPTEIEEHRHQITIEERRKGIQEHIGNPVIRRAMRDIAEAKEGRDPDRGGNGTAIH